MNMRFDTVVAYAYRADIYCRRCIRGRFTVTNPLLTTEELLDEVARLWGIDRMDEHTYDSNDFPKVCFPDMLDNGDRCGDCGEYIIEPHEDANVHERSDH